MHKITGIVSTATFACAIATASALVPLAAQADEGGRWYVAPVLNYLFADGDREADDNFGFQLGIGKELSESWNLEANFEADTLDIDDNSGGEFEQRGLALDGLYFFDRSRGFSPYGLIGAGALKTKVPGEKSTNAMATAGVGFLSNVLSEAVALRAEVRYRWDDDDESIATEDSFGDWIVGIGLNIPFGGSGAKPAAAAAPVATAGVAVAAAPADSDGDGVTDSDDACPDTLAGAMVDARGCEADSDGDGVADSGDRCPGTPAGVSVDMQGCPIDSDADGVIDGSDRCSGTPAGARVDIHGCEIKEVISLPGVNFETGSARLVAGSTAILDEAAATLRKHPDIKAEVAGHTDSTGPRAFNVSLSQQRAETVMNYLVSQGVEAGNLTARGYGPDQPAADNATKDGRAANRRVELKIAE